MPLRISSELSGISRVWGNQPDEELDNIRPMNMLVVSSSGNGKSLTAETIAYNFWQCGYVILSLSDVKNCYEQAFSMFAPGGADSKYQLKFLKQYGCPTEAIPTKLYHPFTFNLPKQKQPDIQFYTLNIKDLTRTDLNYLSESAENKRSIQILLEIAQKLRPSDGLHHLMFNAENQTESIANLTKSTVKYRSDNPDDFYTRAKQGTEKTSSEMNAYFKPFIRDYSLAPANCPHNLDIVEIMNDQKNYHVFSTKWITDPRLKSFYILHLLQEIINHADDAKHPILIYLEEIRKLTPNSSEGYAPFLATELTEKMSIMRNMGGAGGIAILATSQLYMGVHPDVSATFNQIILGKIDSYKELDFIGKTLRLSKQETDILQSIPSKSGKFVIRTTDEYTDDPTFQKIKFWMPPHAHKEEKYDFFDWYEKQYPDKMKNYADLLAEMKATKERVEQEVETLKDKENLSKQEAVRKEREAKAEKEKLRTKVQIQQIEKHEMQKDAMTEKLRMMIWNEYQTATGKDKSTRAIAKKFGLLLRNGEPNPMAVKRALDHVEKQKNAENEKENPTTNEEENENDNDIEKPTNEELYDDKKDNTQE